MPTSLTNGGNHNLEATMIKWVEETIVEWHQSEILALTRKQQNKAFERAKFLDPNVPIVESFGNWGCFRWGAYNNPSGYHNDYVRRSSINQHAIFVHLSNCPLAR
ncbi:uncharacterized protein N7477_006242 [Penicillium maclennaniae]|uniref:uncharacterized protein n=1 Tax=Penicillium maclennaniae TaxID=1343394 RepID=UPI0025422824|nr:uncharacterized protein N7477_006242 [Penicillium maclennaniae]KAJ5667672.1 hypothetical protein N7477_006242 [Penicillium maclennaniae]